LTDEEISQIQSTVPKLPGYYRVAWKDVGFDSTVENALLLSKESAELFDRVRLKAGDKIARRIGFWFLRAITESLDQDQLVRANNEPIPDEYFISLSKMVEEGELNSSAGDIIFDEMQRTSKGPRVIAKERNLIQVNDEREITSIVDEVLSDSANTQSVIDIKDGKDKAIGFLVGQVMKKSKGKANPGVTQKLIRERIK